MVKYDTTDQRRALFDHVSLNVVTKLENFEAVSAIEFGTEDGITLHQISQWGKHNAPLMLPDDIISFYSIFNGINLSWDVMIGLKSVTVGEIRLNELSKMMQISSVHSAAFLLNTQADIGDIVLVYINDTKHELDTFAAKTEIWFRDTSLNWHYVCQSFTHLLRLMVTHLGARSRTNPPSLSITTTYSLCVSVFIFIILLKCFYEDFHTTEYKYCVTD